MSTPALLTSGLTKTYRGRDVVASLDLTVEEGSITALIGPNGCGKTTTLEMVSTLRRPTAGRIRVFGLDPAHAPHDVRRLIGVALQASALDPLMTVSETLRFTGRALGLDPGAATHRCTELLHLLALETWADAGVATLSGGTRRRLDLAVALLGHPRLLILDEPTTGIDPVSRLELWDELRRLRQQLGTTVLLSTQDLHEAESLATSIVMLRDGHALLAGPPSEFRSRVGTRTLSIVSGSEHGAARIEAALHDAGAHSSGPREVRLPLRPEGEDVERPWLPLLARLGPHAADVDAVHLDRPGLDDAFLFLAHAPQEAVS